MDVCGYCECQQDPAMTTMVDLPDGRLACLGCVPPDVFAEHVRRWFGMDDARVAERVADWKSARYADFGGVNGDGGSGGRWLQLVSASA